MMRSKKKRIKKGLPEYDPKEHVCSLCGQPPKEIYPMPVFNEDGTPALDAGGNPIEKVGQMEIDVYNNMEVTVRKFPIDNHGVSMMVVCNALMKLSEFFVMQAHKAKSPIVLAQPGASIGDIEKMRRNN